MGLMRALARAGSLGLAGAAAGYLLRRRGVLGAAPPSLQPATEAPSEPLFVPQGESVQAPSEEPEPEAVQGVVEEPEHEDAPIPDDAELIAVEVEDADVVQPPEAEEERPDVTAVVDDLLAGEGALADAVTVEHAAVADDAGLAEAVRVALAEEPGLLSSPIEIAVHNGAVTLEGELEHPDGIAAVERKVEGLDGVRTVQSLLHLPGIRPPHRG